MSDALDTSPIRLGEEPTELEQPREERRQLPRSTPPLPNALRLLEDVEPRRLPDAIIELAEAAAECPIALYVIDIGGSALRFVAGDDRWPVQIAITQALGPELPRGRMSDVQQAVEVTLEGASVIPLWLHGRAVAVLIADREPLPALEPVARQAAVAVELADRYTDVFSAPRRLRRPTAAAEIQENLLPPRVAHIGGAKLAGGVVPAYEVGGDWYDYAENEDGVWLAVADAAGKGAPAAGASTIALGALRAARRSGADLAGAARLIDASIRELEVPSIFVTAIIARWDATSGTVEFARFGHPLPVVATQYGDVEIAGDIRANVPLGLLRDPAVKTETLELRGGERFILTSDGVWERRRPDHTLFGLAGITQAVRRAVDESAAAAASAIARAVVEASPDPPRDDATVLVLAPEAE